MIVRCALVAEPHHHLAAGVRGLLEPMFEVIVMVAEEASLVDALARMDATVAIVDLSLDSGDGLAMLRRIHARFPGVPLVAIGAYDSPGARRAIAAAGAYAFVSKGALVDALVPAVDAAMRTPEAMAALRARSYGRPAGA